MLQIYSTNVTVPAGSAYPLNTVALQKGNTVVPSGAASIQLNKCGIYMVSCDAYTDPAAEINVQMYKNGIAQPMAISASETAGVAGFTALVQVSENNTNCCCTSPTVLQFVNNDTEAVAGAHINVCVTKVC